MACGVGNEKSWVMKTTVMEKGRGDTGCAMWNQVLLGNGRVKEQGGGPHPPTPTHYKFCSHPISSALRYWPPDLNLPTVLPFLQFLVLPSVTSGPLRGDSGPEKGLSRLPSLGPAPRSQSGFGIAAGSGQGASGPAGPSSTS